MDVITSNAGCDSIHITELIIDSLIYTNSSRNICYLDSAFLGGNYQTTPGIYIDTLNSIDGCDSIVETQLLVDSVLYGLDSLTICFEDSSFLGGSYQTITGNYVDTLSSNAGCDSVLTTYLTVSPLLASFDTMVICTLDSVFLSGNYQTSSGSYIDTLSSINGCDSIVETILQVDSILYGDEIFEVCFGDSVSINGVYYSSSVQLSDTLQSNAGCDSVHTVFVNVNPLILYLDSITICENDSVLLENNYQTTSGIYFDTLTTLSGCDSIIQTTLIVNPTLVQFNTLTICNNDSAYLANAYQTKSGYYNDTIISNSGCDSIITTYLEIIPISYHIDSMTICTNDSIYLEGSYQNSTGVYVDTAVSSSGCDSLIINYLFTDTVLYGTTSASVCNGDSLLVGGSYQNISGTYYDTLISSAGCDSILQTNLTIDPLNYTVDVLTICNLDSTYLEGQYQTTTGSYFDTLVSAKGCDSIVETQLFLDSILYGFDSISVCYGDSVLISGQYYNSSGYYNDTTISNAGCDSITITTLYVEPQLVTNVTTSICNLDSIYLQGGYQTTNGVYVDTLSSIKACDSIVITTLSLDSILLANDTLSICYGDSALIGESFEDISGTYSDTSISNAGCDSITFTYLDIQPLSYSIDTIDICYGDSIFLGSGFQNSTGNYLDILTSASGCDSIRDIHLNIRPEITHVDSITICTLDSIYLQGAFRNISGIYTDTLSSLVGCDSILFTHLSVESILYGYATLHACYGDSALIFGTYEQASGNYYDTTISSAGCDSITELNFIVDPQILTYDTAVICYLDSALLAGDYQNITGQYMDTLQSSDGCDSIVHTFLQVDSTLYYTDSITICYGDSMLLAGAYQLTSGIYEDTLISSAGCDSVVYTLLDVQPLNYVYDTSQICVLDSIFLQSNFQNISGSYVDTLVGFNGCDSIVETFLHVDSVLSGNDSLLLCNGDTILIGNQFVINAGLYEDTLVSNAGCDSVVTYDVDFIPSLYSYDTLKICKNDSIFLQGAYQDVSGDYIDTLTAQTGCDSIVYTHLDVFKWILVNVIDQICSGDSILIAGDFVTMPGTYFDYLQTTAGCDSIVQITLIGSPNSGITIYDSLSLCQGDSAYLGGNYQSSSGTYTNYYQTTTGCDSTIITYLSIDSIPITLQYVSICYTDSFDLNGIYYNTSGLYYDTLIGVTGCDSIIEYELVVDTFVYVPLSISICSNDSIQIGANFYDSSGIYYDTLITNYSCDTIFITELNVEMVYDSLITVTACDTFITNFGDTIISSGIYYDTLSSINGCDSTITYNVAINNSYSILVDTSVFCATLILPNGDSAISSGYYYDSLLAVSGCDSVIAYNVIITCDIDSDNDGISDIDEGTGDTDGDGIPDYLDIDSDNDGIYDVVESGNGDLDTNKDGVIDANDNGFADTNNNGMADDTEGTIPDDTDGDGIADYLDLDSDNDGIYDVDEGGDGDRDTNNDGMVDANDLGFSDNDNDGMADNTEGTIPPDTDNDGHPDYIDLDADNDGIYDVVEGGDGNQDTNGDGMIDNNDLGFSDNDGDGMADNAEPTPAPDTDGNGNPDYIDLDSDGDGCYDVIEAGFNDNDGDGYLGGSPVQEDSIGVVISGIDGYTAPADFDNNGIADFLEEGSEATFITQPTDLEIYNEGDNLVIDADATSLSGIVYQWQYSPDDGITWIDLQDTAYNGTTFMGSSNNTLEMYDMDKSFDNYLFRLVASTPSYVCGKDVISDYSRLTLREIFIPDGFSPDGNGINDTWHITGIDRYLNNHVEVYNRWEIKVYEQDYYNSNDEWDGTVNVKTLIIGQSQLPEGTYFYIIDLGEDKASGRKPIKGYVYIRRSRR
tara:strand:- start:1601 stop:7132 length:5532 start_codon:yes stop_codon:yes gene_type:complete